jgi:hypothetical protein
MRQLHNSPIFVFFIRPTQSYDEDMGASETTPLISKNALSSPTLAELSSVLSEEGLF